jgi:hypothetical protein
MIILFTSYTYSLKVDLSAFGEMLSNYEHHLAPWLRQPTTLARPGRKRWTITCQPSSRAPYEHVSGARVCPSPRRT